MEEIRDGSFYPGFSCVNYHVQHYAGICWQCGEPLRECVLVVKIVPKSNPTLWQRLTDPVDLVYEFQNWVQIGNQWEKLLFSVWRQYKAFGLLPQDLQDKLEAAVGEIPPNLRKMFEEKGLPQGPIETVPKGEYEELRKSHENLLLTLGRQISENVEMIEKLNKPRRKTKP